MDLSIVRITTLLTRQHVNGQGVAEMTALLEFPYAIPGFIVALMVITTGHELGHLIAAKMFGVPVKLIAVGAGPALWQRLGNTLRFEIRLLPLGMSVGVLGRRNNDGSPRRPIEDDMWVAAGGPLASVALSLILFVAALGAGAVPTVQSWLLMTGALSILVMLFNLLPIPGLDGGHLALLSAMKLGLRLSPEREATLHQLGLQVAAALCVVLFIASVAGVV